MLNSFNGWIAGAGLVGLLAVGTPASATVDEALGFEHTPPRLSFVDGEVSFFRPGTLDWAPASVNTALAAGDELYAAEGANLEIQIRARAYVRAGEETQLALASLEPDFLQFRVSEGQFSLDLRTLKASQTLEVDTPNAAFTIEHSGYYRVEVSDEATTFITRRGGRARVTPANGVAADLAASEQVVITDGDVAQLETYAAPELDSWDRWNYARTDAQLDAVSARYVPYGVYGVDDLDHYGDWRVVSGYGAVWVPRGVAVGWAPYSTGRWMYDPYYGWTWVDAAPWGWAPYHYGRWVHISGYWAWAPGPVVVRPYYAPALVAFFGGGRVSLGISIGAPHVGWVALGWGEPIVPWWGPVGVRGVPRWAGWGGPRVVNRVVVKSKTVIHVNDIRDYQNTHVHNALVAVDRKQFGHRAVGEARIASAPAERYKPVHGDLDLRPGRDSLVAASGPARRPPREWRERPVVATREPRVTAVPGLKAPAEQASSKRPKGQARQKGADTSPSPAASRVRLVDRPRSKKRSEALARPPFGTRGQGERATPPQLPRYRSEGAGKAPGHEERPAQAPEARERTAPVAPQTRTPERSTRRAEPTRPEAPASPTPQRTGPRSDDHRTSRGAPREPARSSSRKETSAGPSAPELPSEPASRVFGQRAGRSRSRAEKKPAVQGDSEAPRNGNRQGGSGRRR